MPADDIWNLTRRLRGQMLKRMYFEVKQSA